VLRARRATMPRAATVEAACSATLSRKLGSSRSASIISSAQPRAANSSAAPGDILQTSTEKQGWERYWVAGWASALPYLEAARKTLPASSRSVSIISSAQPRAVSNLAAPRPDFSNSCMYNNAWQYHFPKGKPLVLAMPGIQPALSCPDGGRMRSGTADDSQPGSLHRFEAPPREEGLSG